MVYLIVFVVAFAAAFLQAVTGFGAAIFMMLFFTQLMPIPTATALNGALCMASNITNTALYRKSIRWKQVILPSIAFFVLSFLCIRLTKSMDTTLLKRIFGGVLLLLAIYFLFIAKKLHIRPTAGASVMCGTLAGITGGMFGASAPPMVVYFLAATDSKEAYIGTLQAFCLVTGLWAFFVRLGSGFYEVKMIPLILLGAGGVLLGQWLGSRLIHKISADTLRTLVYLMLAVSGLLNLLG